MQPHFGQPIGSAGVPLGRGKGVVVMVHGRGAAPANILDLVPRLDRPDFTYLAPSASGRTWYPLSFLSETSKNEPGLSSGLAMLDFADDDWDDVASRRGRLALFVSPKLLKQA